MGILITVIIFCICLSVCVKTGCNLAKQIGKTMTKINKDVKK